MSHCVMVNSTEKSEKSQPMEVPQLASVETQLHR